jgi:hypothetical protein
MTAVVNRRKVAFYAFSAVKMEVSRKSKKYSLPLSCNEQSAIGFFRPSPFFRY